MGKAKPKLQQGLAKLQYQKSISDKNKKAAINAQPYSKKKPKMLDRYDPARLDQGKSNLKEKLGQLSEAQLKGYNKERLKHSKVLYGASDKILLLGEGNFSFSSALCKLFGNGSNIWATSYDSEEVLKQKYGDDCLNHIEFIKGCGGKVFHGIDGTNLEKHRKTFLFAHNNEAKEQDFVQGSFGSSFRNANEIFFDKIVINFPHCGLGIKDQRKNILANQKLLSGIFKSARSVALPESGELHVTIKSGLPYELWRVAALAKEEGHWHQASCIPFNPELYPGYEHRRTLGFEAGISSSENLEIKEKYPKTYVFSLSPNVAVSKKNSSSKKNKEQI